MPPHSGPAAHFPDGKPRSKRVRDSSKYLQLMRGCQSPEVVGRLLDNPPGPPARHAVLPPGPPAWATRPACSSHHSPEPSQSLGSLICNMGTTISNSQGFVAFTFFLNERRGPARHICSDASPAKFPFISSQSSQVPKSRKRGVGNPGGEVIKIEGKVQEGERHVLNDLDQSFLTFF